jgi:hypothetical protein
MFIFQAICKDLRVDSECCPCAFVYKTDRERKGRRERKREGKKEESRGREGRGGERDTTLHYLHTRDREWTVSMVFIRLSKWSLYPGKNCCSYRHGFK